MAIKYYLCNGETGVANGINLKVNGDLKRDFDDIAELDLQTMGIKYDKAKSILQEYNEDINLDGWFFDTKYPFKGTETKNFPVLFESDDAETLHLFDFLKEMADERLYNIKTGKSWDISENTNSHHFYRSILYRIMKTENPYFYAGGRTYSQILRDIFCEKMTRRQSEDINHYISRTLYYNNTVNKTVHSYTQLRLLLLEYLNYLNQASYYTDREKLESFNHMSYNKLEPFTGQMDIFDYLNQQEESKKMKKKK